MNRLIHGVAAWLLLCVSLTLCPCLDAAEPEAISAGRIFRQSRDAFKRREFEEAEGLALKAKKRAIAVGDRETARKCRQFLMTLLIGGKEYAAALRIAVEHTEAGARDGDWCDELEGLASQAEIHEANGDVQALIRVRVQSYKHIRSILHQNETRSWIPCRDVPGRPQRSREKLMSQAADLLHHLAGDFEGLGLADKTEQAREVRTKILDRIAAKDRHEQDEARRRWEAKLNDQETLDEKLEILRTDPGTNGVTSSDIISAYQYFHGWGSRAKVGLPVFIENLDPESPRHHWQVFTILGGIGPEAKGAVPKLVELLGREDASLRNHVSQTLEGIGVTEPVYIERVLDAMCLVENRGALAGLSRSLQGAGVSMADFIPDRLRCARTEDQKVCLLDLLGRQQEEARDRASAIELFLNDESEVVQLAAAAAHLWVTGDGTHLRSLESKVKDDAIRRRASRILSHGPPPPDP